MGIMITNAILHVVYNDGQKPIVSNEELDFESEACYEFITKHLTRLLRNHSLKKATFNLESEVYNNLLQLKSGEIYFKDFSNLAFEKLSEIIMSNPEIPSGDILFVKFIKDETEHIGILKLNYNNFFTHKTNHNENGTENQIVKYNLALPLTSGKIHEACIIPFSPMEIELLEKSYIINGEPTFYFSEIFLDCQTEISKKESVDIVTEVTEEINNKYFSDRVDSFAKIKNIIVEEAEENEGTIRMENIARKVFGEDEEAKTEYISALNDLGIKEDLEIDKKYIKNKFGTQSFKSENGIELKFPSNLSLDEDSIEFTNHSDGSVTITLKNLRKK